MHSTTSTLADGDRSASFLDPEKNRSTELSGGSTRAPSTFDMEKKGGNETDTETATVEGVPPADNQVDADAEYPTGIRLAVIVLALILSVFLVSLDMVSQYQPRKENCKGSSC